MSAKSSALFLYLNGAARKTAAQTVVLVVLTVGHLAWTSRYSEASGRYNVRKDCRFHPKNLNKPNKPTLLAQKVRGHVETTHWYLTVTFAFLQHFVRSVYLLLPFLKVGFAENCFSTGPIWVSNGESI